MGFLVNTRIKTLDHSCKMSVINYIVNPESLK